MDRHASDNPDRRTTPWRRGFSLVELIVTLVIILILTSVVLAAVFGVISGSRKANIEQQMNTIGQGLEVFRNDFQAYPPLITSLDAGDGSVLTPETVGGTNNTLINNVYFGSRFYSEWSLTAYLVGVGDLDGDGEASTEMDDGEAAFGIRDPGRTRAWKSPDGAHAPARSGRVFGPYLDPGSMDKYLERVEVEPFGPRDRIVESASPTGNGQALFRLVDAYGAPIRYYKNWPANRPADDGNEPNAPSAFYAPLELRTPETVEAQIDGKIDPDEANQFVDRPVMSSPYMLLSAGEDADRYVDNQGNRVLAYGDVLLDGAGNTTDLRVFAGQVTQPPSDEELINQLISRLESNVRYTP